MVCDFAKISHQSDLQKYYFTLELAIELYWWHAKCLLRNMLLKIASYGTYHIIMEFSRIFNANLRLIWANCYLSNRWLHCIQTWWDNLSHTNDWFICNNNLLWPEFFNSLFNRFKFSDFSHNQISVGLSTQPT